MSTVPPPEDVRAFRDEVWRIADDIGEAHCEPGCPEKNPFVAQIERGLLAAVADFDRAADLAALQSTKATVNPDDDLLAEAERVVGVTASHCPPGCTPENCIQHALLAKLRARRGG